MTDGRVGEGGAAGVGIAAAGADVGGERSEATGDVPAGEGSSSGRREAGGGATEGTGVAPTVGVAGTGRVADAGTGTGTGVEPADGAWTIGAALFRVRVASRATASSGFGLETVAGADGAIGAGEFTTGARPIGGPLFRFRVRDRPASTASGEGPRRPSATGSLVCGSTA